VLVSRGGDGGLGGGREAYLAHGVRGGSVEPIDRVAHLELRHVCCFTLGVCSCE